MPKGCDGCKNCASTEKHEQQTLMFQFVMPLYSEFEKYAFSFLDVPFPTFAEAHTALIAEKTRLRALATTSMISHTILAAPHRTRVFKAPSSVNIIVYTHCKKTGHRAQNCSKLHPEQFVEFRVRRSAGSRHGVVTSASSCSDPHVHASRSIASNVYMRY